MKIFQKIKIKLKNGKSRQIRLLGVPVFEYSIIEDSASKKTVCSFPFIHGFGSYSTKPEKSKPVFYLKMNRSDSYSLLCLQHWLNIVETLDSDFYIICDKEKLELKILTTLVFKNKNIKFSRSIKKPLHTIVKNIATSFWVNTTYAQLTVFYHAKRNSIKNFWNIDADDTMFLVESATAANIIKQVASYAEEKDISAFSLDMHRSFWRGKHWSFGVTYVNGNRDYFEIFNNNKNNKWQEYYSDMDIHFNLDWFFTYLNSIHTIKAETFYIENLYFMHTGDFLRCPTGAKISFWKNGKLNFPILTTIFGSKDLGIIPIAKDIVKFDLNIKENDCFKFLLDNFCIEKYYPYFLRKNIGLDIVFPQREEEISSKPNLF